MDNIMTNEEENEEQYEMEYNHSPEGGSRILEYQEISDAEYNVIKGDTIGETLYSSKWILNTLIGLSKVYEEGWSKSMENDLCILWDMTTEKDVVEFLLQNDFFNMAEFALKTSEEPRLMEIIVGIIGNMCCVPKSLEMLINADELVSTLLSLLSSNDTETLIQVLRILQAVVWNIQKNPQSPWLKKIEECKIIGNAIPFILKSSTSALLLTPTIDFVYLVSDIELPNNVNFFENIFNVDDQLIFALCESMMELINQTDSSHTEALPKNIQNWLNIIFNMIKKNLLKFSDNESDENFIKINIVLTRILQPYENLNNFMPLEEHCLCLILQCTKLIFSFQKSDMLPNIELIKIVATIMVNLKLAAIENEYGGSDDFRELYDYILNYWIETLKIVNKEQILELMQLCDIKTVNNIMEITYSLSAVSENRLTELLEAKSMIFSD